VVKADMTRFLLEAYSKYDTLAAIRGHDLPF
jgi:hypothetical protein